jgi:hypothetical protein
MREKLTGKPEKTSCSFVFTSLFWESIEQYRVNGQYLGIRAKIRELMQCREAGSPHPREKMFLGGQLKGICHFQIMTKPDVVLFHTVSDQEVVFCMIGDHSDYAFKGKNVSANIRTANLINNSGKQNILSPLWETAPRWTNPTNLFTHPDLPELSHESLDSLLNSIEDEANTGRRYFMTHGKRLENEEIKVIDQYLHDIIRLIDKLNDIKIQKRGVLYDGLDSWERFKTYGT